MRPEKLQVDFRESKKNSCYLLAGLKLSDVPLRPLSRVVLYLECGVKDSVQNNEVPFRSF